MPYSKTTTVTITPPAGFSGPKTISFTVEATAYPVGTKEQAAAYVSIAPVTFDSAAAKTITINVNMPSINLPPNTVVTFAYQIRTAGWGVAASDAGFSLNAKVTSPPPAEGGPPVVTIVTPNQPVYSGYTSSQFPITLPLKFQVVTATLDADGNPLADPDEIQSIFATLNGVPLKPANFPLNPNPNNWAETGIGQVSAEGTANLPIPAPGIYTVFASGANSAGPASRSVTFEVKATGPAPTVTIEKPLSNSDYVFFVGGNNVVPEVRLKAESQVGAPLVSWTAELTYPSGLKEPSPIAPITPESGNTAILWYGSRAFALNLSGQYKLTLKATNTYGDAVPAETTFWINRLTSPASKTIPVFTSTSFTVAVEGRGAGSYSYQWGRQLANGTFSALSDGGYYSNTTAPTLSVSNAPLSLSGEKYVCRVTIAGSSNYFDSAAATLTVLKLDQTITYTAPASITGGNGFNLQAAVSPDPSRTLTYEAIGGVAQVDSTGNVTTPVVTLPTVTLLKISQAGDEIYNAASVTHQLTVLPVAQPNPAVTINSPTGDVSLPVGQTTVPVVLTFTSTPNAGFAISRVVAVLDGTTYDSATGAITSSPSLPSAAATLGQFTANLGAGSHSLKVTSYIGNTASTPAEQTFAVVAQVEPSCGTALVRHAAVMNGQALIRGSLKIMTGEKMSLNGNAWITDSLYLPGTPTVRLTGQSVVGESLSAQGNAAPVKYTLTLNGQAAIGTLVTQSNAVELADVAAPPASTGSRNVSINKPGDSLGDPATIRDLTVNGNVGAVTLPPGTYRDVTIHGKNVLILTPGTYNIRELRLNGTDEVRLDGTGAVVINVAKEVKFNGTFNTSADPSRLKLNIADGGLTLDGNASFYGFVNAPSGEVTLNGLDLLKGGLIADKLTINGQGVVELCHTP